jgi:hypothetical protein
MSGLSSPAAFMMSMISVETTARLTICWIASSRSASVFLPSPGTLLTSASAAGGPVGKGYSKAPPRRCGGPRRPLAKAGRRPL